jgi:hypothetical protein
VIGAGIAATAMPSSVSRTRLQLSARRRITIDHRPLDWFTHLGATMSYGGSAVDRYLARHPVDHVRWGLAKQAPGGGAGEGARFRIVERFAYRPEYHVDVVDTVETLDQTGIRLVQRVAGIVVFQLQHTWSPGSDGVHCGSVVESGRARQLEYLLPQISREAEPAQRA